MAERTSTARDEASARARALLIASLDDEQRADLERYDGFRVRKVKALYWLRIGGAPVCADLVWERFRSYCVAPDRLGGMPPEDIALTFLIWLTADAEHFQRTANVMRNDPIPAGLSEDEILSRLRRRARPHLPHAHPAVRAPRRRTGDGPTWLQRYSRAQPIPDPTPEDRARAVRHLSEIRTRLRMERIRPIFEACSTAPDDETLWRLAQHWPVSTSTR